MRKQQIAFTLGLVVALSAAILAWSAESAQSFRADELLADIKLHGASVVVAKLRVNNRDWDEVMARIATGQGDWLDVATALRPGTDAGASETLDEAIFLAIESAPVTVLRLLDGNPFDTDFVCSSNIETDNSPEKSLHFVQDRIKVLRRVSAPELQSVRNHCLKNLRAAMKEIVDPIY